MAEAAPPCNTSSSTPQSVEQLLQACIHCGMCLTSCPTYVATGNEAESPRGRLYLMQKWNEGVLSEADDLAPYLDNCLGCLNCQTVCPSGVQYGSLLNTHRATLLEQRSPSPWRWVQQLAFKWILPNPALLTLMTRGLRLYQQTGLRWLLAKLGVLALLAKVAPKLAHAETLAPTVPAPCPTLKAGQSFGDPTDPTVALHLGCLMNAMFAPVHWATIKVLVANRYHVVLAHQTCCGALAHHAGEVAIATSLAETNLALWQRHDPTPVALLFNSAGCGAELHEYGHLLPPEHPNHAQALALGQASVDVAAWLMKDGALPVPPPLAVPLSVTYHAACHLHHAQRVQTQPVDLLKSIPGLTLTPLTEAETCCGSAGIYNLQHPELSEPILERKMTHVVATQANIVATGNPGCQMQLQHGLRQVGSSQQVMHPIELLAMAYPSQLGVWQPKAIPSA
jgi:glycolate oxidase iron-sulfur subunit